MREQAKCNIPVKMQYTGHTFDVPLIIGITKEVALENSKEECKEKYLQGYFRGKTIMDSHLLTIDAFNRLLSQIIHKLQIQLRTVEIYAFPSVGILGKARCVFPSFPLWHTFQSFFQATAQTTKMYWNQWIWNAMYQDIKTLGHGL